MFHLIFTTLSRRLSAFLCIVSISCTIIVLLLIGGLSRALTTQTSSGHGADEPHHATHSAILLNAANGVDEYAPPNTRSQNALSTDTMSMYSDARALDRSTYLSTKIVYKPYASMNAVRKNAEYQRKMAIDDGEDVKGPTPKSTKSINSTTSKRITPSITDRVIADLRNEEYLASQKMQRSEDKNNSAYDDAIYIDADDEDASSTTQAMPTTTEAKPLEANADGGDGGDGTASDAKPPQYKKTASKNVYVGVRDKKSQKKPILIKHESSEKREYADSNDSSERFEYDDDDDDGDDDYNDFNSGSGDYNTNQYGGAQNWRPTTIDETKLKRLIFKHESSVEVEDSINANADDNANDDEDDDDDDDSIEPDVDSTQQQRISAKIAYAHKKLLQKAPVKNQKPARKLESKSNADKGGNNRDKSNAVNYVDWSGSDETNGDRSAEKEATAGRNDWIEPRIRRILDNIKRSEERSQQILLCKGEGELCNMLFKRPNQPAEP